MAPDSDGGLDRLPPPPVALALTLSVANTGEEAFTFTTGLRTRLATEDARTHGQYIKAVGLHGKHTLRRESNPARPRIRVENEQAVSFGGRQLDRVYVDCGAREFIAVCPGHAAHVEVKNLRGFDDVALDHPALSYPEEARWSVGIAPARVARPVRRVLEPGETWTGEAHLIARQEYWDQAPWEREAGLSAVPPPRLDSLRKTKIFQRQPSPARGD
ncbi:hypothetical protein F751_5077 [Auxenochlorella protothecoides]|nr:hypothetical protein F751_5077 [Auxenochlorella protothecoides]KFM24235.1 hypothetical protein F751_5077 [Auxenochlorella protothecoides]